MQRRNNVRKKSLVKRPSSWLKRQKSPRRRSRPSKLAGGDPEVAHLPIKRGIDMITEDIPELTMPLISDFAFGVLSVTAPFIVQAASNVLYYMRDPSTFR